MTGRSFALHGALALLLAAPAAMAANLCDGACAVSVDFPLGGSINAEGGATITFGSGGALVLGEGGSLTLGEGGSITPEGGEMGGGGSVVLGAGGSLQFGPGGSLATGEAGAIAAEGIFQVASASTVAISSAQAVHLGDLESHGRIELTTEGDVDGCDTSTPMHFSMVTDDTETLLTVNATAGISMGTLKGRPDLYVTSGSTITLCAEDGTFDWEDGSGGGSGNPGDGGSGVIMTGDGDMTWTCEGCNEVVVVEPANLSVVEFGGPTGGGSPGVVTLLLMAAAAGLRRRRIC